MLPLVRGLLGLEGHAPGRHLVFEPHLPPHWDAVAVDTYRLGEATFALRYRRTPGTLTVTVTQDGGASHRMTFAPALGAGTHIRALTAHR